MTTRQWIATDERGDELLITFWDDGRGTPQVAPRLDSTRWGAPYAVRDAEPPEVCDACPERVDPDARCTHGRSLCPECLTRCPECRDELRDASLAVR